MSGQLERQQSLLTADLHKMNLDDRPDVHFSRRVSSNMNLEAIMTVQQSGDIDDDGDDWTTDGAKGSAHFRRKSVSSAAKLHMVEWSDLTGRRKLGEGAYATVSKASLKGMNVAVKQLKVERCSEQLAIDDLEGELKLMCMLNHQNVLKVLGRGQQEGALFIVVELLDETLASRLTKRCPRPRALSYGAQLAAALRYLHRYHSSVRILHRDLKPDNIGFCGERLVLVDFGLAKVWSVLDEEDSPRSLTGETGSLRYMAPEVALSQPYGYKSEVYGFALLFWQMLANARPYEGITPSTFVPKVCREGLRPRLDPAWPEQLRTLLGRCWDADQALRPCSGQLLKQT